MSNVLGIIIGVVVIIVGLILLVTWWAIFVKALMAVVPVLLVLIGAGLLIYFLSEIKSKLEMGLRQEVATARTADRVAAGLLGDRRRQLAGEQAIDHQLRHAGLGHANCSSIRRCRRAARSLTWRREQPRSAAISSWVSSSQCR